MHAAASDVDARPLIAAIDGSDASLRAVQVALALFQPPGQVLIATVLEQSDPDLVVGTGFAGGVMSADELQDVDDARLSDASRDLEAAAAALAIPGAETIIVRGDPARALCDLAAERGARAIAMGTRGRGGIKRALLGSVSDFIVRNAPCPVVISRPDE